VRCAKIDETLLVISLPSTAFSYPDWLLSLLPSIMSASWARLGRMSSRYAGWMWLDMFNPATMRAGERLSTRDNCCLADDADD